MKHEPIQLLRSTKFVLGNLALLTILVTTVAQAGTCGQTSTTACAPQGSCGPACSPL